MRANSGVCRPWARLGVDFSSLGAPPDAPGRCPRTSSTDLGRLDLPRSTHFDRLGCLDRLRNTHFDPLGRILGQLSSFPAIGPGIELPCRAQLTIGPGRSGQVSSFPAALSLPTIRLAKQKSIDELASHDLQQSPCIVRAMPRLWLIIMLRMGQPKGKN